MKMESYFGSLLLKKYHPSNSTLFLSQENRKHEIHHSHRTPNQRLSCTIHRNQDFRSKETSSSISLSQAK